MFVLMFLYFVLCPLECFAEEYPERETESLLEGIEGQYINSGYTESGIYYEVYGVTIDIQISEYVTVSRTIVYEGDIEPSSTIFWGEWINGEWYTGTLSLLRYNTVLNQTSAVYIGKLYKN